MTEKITVRVKIQTPLGDYCVSVDEIENSKTAYQDYVEEVTALLIHSDEGFYSFSDNEGDIVFLMQGVINNSIITAEKM